MFPIGAAIFAVLALPAVAEPRHDTKLEQAVKEIVARKMRLADMRGSLAFGQAPSMVVVVSTPPRTGVVDAPSARHKSEARTPSFVTIDPVD
jgi:hypothetical protein